jgi:hypothetical protein
MTEPTNVREKAFHLYFVYTSPTDAQEDDREDACRTPEHGRARHGRF